jgi:hypothetical protein
LPTLSFLAASAQVPELVLEQRTEASESEQSEEVSNIPAVAAASQFGIESASSFKPRGFTKKNSTVDSDGAPTPQSDVDIALARANAAAAGEQPAAAIDAKNEESLEVKNRRLEAQVQALQQYKKQARDQINQLRQANAVAGNGNSGDFQ